MIPPGDCMYAGRKRRKPIQKQLRSPFKYGPSVAGCVTKPAFREELRDKSRGEATERYKSDCASCAPGCSNCQTSKTHNVCCSEGQIISIKRPLKELFIGFFFCHFP